MENQNTRDKTFQKFKLTIQNASKLASGKVYSDNLFFCGHSWRFDIYAGVSNVVDYLQIYLDAGTKLPSNWSKVVKLQLSLINQVDCKNRKAEVMQHLFSARGTTRFLAAIINLGEELCKSKRGFIVNDTFILEGEISIKSEGENPEDQAFCKIEVLEDSPQVKMNSASYDGVIDFRGLGKLDKAFIPLLEEVCSRHPSLIECHSKRTRRFTEWAFTALGRVLHFLKTRKVKDMNDDDCKHFQILWEELEMCRFDLTWLEPNVQSVLSSKLVKKRKLKVEAL